MLPASACIAVTTPSCGAVMTNLPPRLGLGDLLFQRGDGAFELRHLELVLERQLPQLRFQHQPVAQQRLPAALQRLHADRLAELFVGRFLQAVPAHRRLSNSCRCRSTFCSARASLAFCSSNSWTISACSWLTAASRAVAVLQLLGEAAMPGAPGRRPCCRAGWTAGGRPPGRIEPSSCALQLGREHGQRASAWTPIALLRMSSATCRAAARRPGRAPCSGDQPAVDARLAGVFGQPEQGEQRRRRDQREAGDQVVGGARREQHGAQPLAPAVPPITSWRNRGAPRASRPAAACRGPVVDPSWASS